ncbi:MAG: (2Fe-2S)-binding protein [Acidimicrobiia bacterium]|nr:(2Fe-2S)-binding protein [Acidimicrobiia bacterium]
MSELVTITVDGREVQVPAGQLLIKALQDSGTYVPHFCWHERLKPAGMCRACLVEVDGPRGMALMTACTLPVADGMNVATRSENAVAAQEGVLEFLLINHPLDCPVCDKGGECPLQDQTVAFGPGESRFVEDKRHYAKPIPISDLVLLDRERCILCARCTRFADERLRPVDYIHRARWQYTGAELRRGSLRFVFLGQHGSDLPGRRSDLEFVSVQGAPLGLGHHGLIVHNLFGRLSFRTAVIL